MMDFMEKRKEIIEKTIPFASSLVGDYQAVVNEEGITIYGLRFFEKLEVQPRKGNMVGLIAAPGAGKSTVSGVLVGDFLDDPRNKGYIAIVSTELSKDEYMDILMRRFGEDEPEKLSRVIIIDCYNKDGSDRDLTAGAIKRELLTYKTMLNADIDMVIIDHFHEVYNNGSVDYNPVAKDIKGLAKEVDCLVILPSQTTKEKAQGGEAPVPKDGCYGCSKFENLCSHIFTVFHPLKRVQNECNLPALGWQVTKIRWKRKGDGIKEGINYVYKYVPETDDLVELSPDETFEFQMAYEKVLELRSAEDKKKSFAFDLSTTIKGKDGKEVRLTKIVGGNDVGEN